MTKLTQLEVEKKVLLKRLSKNFNRLKNSRPIVDTGLGFYVQGGYEDLQNLIVAKDLGMNQVRDVNNTFHTVSQEDWDAILLSVKSSAVQKFQQKWLLEENISTAETLDEVRQIEASSDLL